MFASQRLPSFLFLFFFFLPFSFLNDGGRDVSTFGSKGIVLYVRVGVLAFFTRGPHDDVPFPLFFTPDDESSSSPCSRSTLINFDFSDGLIEYQRCFECLEFFFLFLSLSPLVDRKLAVSIHLPRVKPFKLSVTKEGIYMASNIE